MQTQKFIVLATLSLVLVLAPGVAIAKKVDKTNHGKGIGKGGVPALRDRLEAEISQLQLDLQGQIDALQGQVDGLKGQIEELNQFIDNDLDGFSEKQGDCDDENDGVNPGAEEIPGNDIDEDCVDGPAPVSPSANAHN